MNYTFKAKRLGNHWYLDIEHNDLYEIVLNEKIDRVLSKVSNDTVIINLYEVYSIADENTIFFDESDILRYLTTDDDFNLRFWIGDHEFYISSDLYYCLEMNYNVNFHKSMYTIDLCGI